MLVSVALAFLAAAVEPAAVAPTQAPAAKPKKICHVEEAVTGSLTPKRVCVTVPAAAPPQKPAQDTAGGQPQQGAPAGSGNGN